LPAPIAKRSSVALGEREIIRCGVDAIADVVGAQARAMIEKTRSKPLVRIKKLPQELREEM
jgi:hypothetical protein